MNSNRAGGGANPVSITVLGSGDAFASEGRAQSAYIVDGGGQRILLEAGPDLLRLLKAAGIAPESIDLMIVSHLHGDHIAGLPFLMLEYMWETPRKRPLTIVGPRNLAERTLGLLRLLYPNFDLSKPGKKTTAADLHKMLKFVVLEPDQKLRTRNVKITAIRSPHTKPDISLSLRIEVGGRTIVFSGDSGWNDALPEFARGADLFLCECTYYESKHLVFHLNYPELAASRDKFNVGRMILTHLGREVLRHKREIDSGDDRLELAFDGMKIEL
jgi:ribonuclease BN (tRNA processing enzyme)